MVPGVSRSRRREASGMIEGLAACFAGLADPRATRRCDHRLIDILVIAVCAVIACAESWEDIALYGRICQVSRQPVPAAQFLRRSAAVRFLNLAEKAATHARILR